MWEVPQVRVIGVRRHGCPGAPAQKTKTAEQKPNPKRPPQARILTDVAYTAVF